MRRIETIEEVKALGYGAVVRDRAEYVMVNAGENEWYVAGSESRFFDDEVDLPADVLYER